MIKIIIGADLVPTTTNYELFNNKDIEQLIGSNLLSILKDADFTIFNLEVPLTDVELPIEKNGPNLIAPTSTIKGLKEINSHFFTLANNHILDQGEDGLISTIECLKKNGIAFAGAGVNLNEAKKPYIFTTEGLTIGIYCCVEHEFSIATTNSCGANPYDPLFSFDDVYDLKQKCDFVVVLYHGGKEH